MAIYKLVTCDGCDDDVKVPDGVNDDFFHIKVTAGSWGKHVDLCPSCHTKLLKQIDPGNWTRGPQPTPSALVPDKNSASGFRVA